MDDNNSDIGLGWALLVAAVSIGLILATAIYLT